MSVFSSQEKFPYWMNTNLSDLVIVVMFTNWAIKPWPHIVGSCTYLCGLSRAIFFRWTRLRGSAWRSWKSFGVLARRGRKAEFWDQWPIHLRKRFEKKNHGNWINMIHTWSIYAQILEVEAIQLMKMWLNHAIRATQMLTIMLKYESLHVPQEWLSFVGKYSSSTEPLGCTSI